MHMCVCDLHGCVCMMCMGVYAKCVCVWVCMGVCVSDVRAHLSKKSVKGM